MIRIDENYSIIIDKSFSLRFEEPREKYSKKQKQNVDYTYYESFYFPSLAMALEKYVEIKQKEAKDVDELIEISKDIRLTLDRFEGIYYKEGLKI